MKKVLLIIPAYNEEKNILNVYQSIVEYNKKAKRKLDFIVINDGSKDKTGEICRKNKIPTIHLIQNLGIGGAVQTGYKYAFSHQYDIAVQFDGDGQHNVNYIEKLLEPIEKENIDMVIGSRFIQNQESNFQSSFTRRIGIRLISKVIKFKTKTKIYDTTSGFRAVNQEIITLFAEQYPKEYPEPISTVDVLNKNYKVKEIAVDMNQRKEGTSSIHSYKAIYYMFNVILSILLKENSKYQYRGGNNL